MATAALGIKLRCASWQQLATIYRRDLSKGTMFLKASAPPPVGTTVRIDLTLPSGSVIVLNGAVDKHVSDPQRGSGVELKLAPIATGSIWLIESALASEAKRTGSTPTVGGVAAVSNTTGSIPTISDRSSGVPHPVASTASGPVTMSTGDGQDLAAAEVDLIRALVAEAESLKKLNPFLVLGLGYEASDADVRAAFAELTKRYHPDRFARYQSTELRQVAAEIFILIRDAYRKLGDEPGRQSVLSTLGRVPRTIQVPVIRTPTPAMGVPAIPAGASSSGASSSSAVSNHALTQPLSKDPSRDSSRAIAKDSPMAIPQDPSQTPATTIPVVQRPGFPRPGTDKPVGAIRGAVDQSRGGPKKPAPPDRRPAITQQPPSNVADANDTSALEELLDAGRIDEALAGYRLHAKKHPQDRSARAGIELCEGLAALAQRDRLEAAQRFEAALEIDPSNERAARELADMRRQATNERKGLLSRLMGKKE